MKFWKLRRKLDTRLPSFFFPEEKEMNTFNLIDPNPKIHLWKSIAVEVAQSEYAPPFTDPMYGDFMGLYGILTLVDNVIIPLLMPLIGDQVEFLPLEFPLRKISFMHVTNAVTCLDQERSEFSYSKDRKTGVRHYVFEKECLKNQHIFVLPEESYLRVHVSDEFKNLVEANSLEGLRFVDAQFEII